MDVSVGIVGAGPAGLLAANVLTRNGIDCVVLERLSEDAARPRTRAGLIEARTAALLDRRGLADGMRTRGSTAGACEFRSGAEASRPSPPSPIPPCAVRC